MVAVSGCFGSILYLQVEKYLNDGGKHPKMAFGAIILIDIVELIFLGICIMFGLYGQSEGGHGEEEEDVKEAEDVYMEYAKFGFKGPVYLMPVGGVESVYNLNAKNVALAAMKRGWRYSDRLQVPLFKNEWGT